MCRQPKTESKPPKGYTDQQLITTGRALGALRKDGMPDGFLPQIANDPLLRRWLVGKMQHRLQTPSQMEAMRLFGARSMIRPMALERFFGELSDLDFMALSQVPYRPATLKICGHNHILWPDLGFSILRMVDLPCMRSSFEPQDWYHAGHGFASSPGRVRWRLTFPVMIQGSTSVGWGERMQLVDSGTHELLTARELIAFVLTCRLVLSRRVFERCVINTDDLFQGGANARHITVHMQANGKIALDARDRSWENRENGWASSIRSAK